jgi:hypothetical protein
MELKYSQAIKAGVIGGVAISIVLVAVMAINIIGSWTTDIIGLCGCCAWIFYLLFMLGTGVLAVRYTAPMLKDMNDVLMVSGFAGAVGGLIAGAVSAVIQFIAPFLNANYVNPNDISGSLGVAGVTSVAGGFMSICCCLPVWIVLTAVIAAIGGLIYHAVGIKKA